MSASGIEESRILAELVKLSEKKFRTLIVNFFNRQGAHAVDTHGVDERGVDIEVTVDKDPIKRNSVILIQVKVGDVKIPEWRRNLCAQISNLIYRRPIENNIPSVTPRRILFITSGEIHTKVHDEINDWNSRLPIPVESFDGVQFSHLLHENNYKAGDIPRLLKERKPPQKRVSVTTRPSRPIPVTTITGPATTTRPDRNNGVRIGRTGSEDAAEYF